MHSTTRPWVITAAASLILAAVLGVAHYSSLQATAANEKQLLLLSDQVQALQAELRAGKLAVAAASSQPATTGDKATPAGSDAESEKSGKPTEKNPMAALMKGLGKMMESKEAQAGFREMTKGAISSQFSDLFDLLELDDTQKAALTEMLSAAEAEQQAAGFALFSGKSKEEIKTLVAEMAEKQKAANLQVKELLGPEKYQNYQRYVDSKPEREQLAMLKGSLKSRNEPLTEDQEQKVLDTLYAERKAYPWTLDYSNDKEWDPKKMDMGNIATFVEQQKAFDTQMETKMNGVLTPTQLEGFQQTNQQRQTMTEFAMGMMKGVLGE